ncbi:MAG: hypothetical protein IT372_28120 [Polyangiaceae bacterium]|nr:hypothetical protein [Polyangiaceae bacterium]
MRPVSVWLALLLVLLPARARAAADPACVAAVKPWADGCALARGLAVLPRACPQGRLILSIRAEGGTALDVDVGPPVPGAFRVAGGLSIAPVAEMADWSQAPAAHRRALDDLAACLDQDPALARLLPPQPSREVQRPAAARPSPVVLLIGLAAAAAACALRRRAPRSPGRRASWVPLAALSVAALAFRWLALPRAFFHQNGHGPSWIAYALGTADLERYGPGYAEVFGEIARLAPAAPEAAVFAAQALAGAAIPALAFSIARRAGAGRALALALAVPLVVDPALGRMAQGESYFNACAALLFAAAAALAAGARGSPRRPGFWIAALAAGLLVAQAARIHPLCWVPAATLPAVVLVQRGRLRRRIALAAASAAVIGVVVGVVALPAMRAVIAGPLGRQWMSDIAVGAGGWAQIAAAAAAAVIAWRTSPRAVLPIAVGAACLVVAVAANRVRHDDPRISAACLRLAWPALIAAAAAALSSMPLAARARSALCAAVALAGAAHAASTFRPMAALPTDAVEADWALRWRGRLPAGARVIYLHSAERRVVALPLYPPAAGPAPDALDAGALAHATALGPGVYYYRSSLCGTEEGREACAAFERRHTLRLLEERDLPSSASVPWLPMPPGPIRAALYEIE